MHAATAAGAWRHYDRGRHHYTWRCYDGRTAIVHTTIVTIATAAAVRTTMKPDTTSASDRNRQARLCLVKRRERHGLAAGNAKEANAEYRCERKKFIHSFLL
jgi:hypothetical protein